MSHADIEDMLHANEIDVRLRDLYDAMDDGLLSGERPQSVRLGT